MSQKQQYKGPMDYIDVATRIADFREMYPDGRLRRADLQFIEFGNKSWVVYTAEAWRTADDPAPAQGTAWEPVPGPTNFTRDSEVQNAETAAWGRAIVAALASDTRNGVASREEVRNRQRDTEQERADDLKAWGDKLLAFEQQGDRAKVHAGMEWAGKNGDQQKFEMAKGIFDRMPAPTEVVAEVLDGEVIADGSTAQSSNT